MEMPTQQHHAQLLGLSPHRKGAAKQGKWLARHTSVALPIGAQQSAERQQRIDTTHKRLQEIEKTLVRKRLVSREDKETLTTIPDQYASRVYDVHILSHPQSHTIVHIVHETHDY